MVTTREVLEQGSALARQVLGPIAAPLTTPIDFVQALERMAQSEQRLEEARRKLIALDAQGIARPMDYVAYDKVRNNVYAATRRLVDPLRTWIARVHPSALARIPEVRLAPPVTPGSGRYLQSIERLDVTPPSTAGLGNPLIPVAVGAGAAWPVVAIILAALTALLLIALIATAIAVTAEMIRDSIVAEAQTRALLATNEARKHVYDDCRGGGGSSADCARTAAELAPTPREALPDLPPAGEGWSWIAWTAGAVAVVTLAIGAVYIYRNERGDRSSMRVSAIEGVRPKRIRAKPGRRARRPYNLEVE